MTARDVPVEIEDLLSHHAWVRRLALTLTRDVDDADDIVQQTYLTALRSPPRHAASPRGWLATVLRNAVRQRARADGRRVRRETVVARPGTAHGRNDPAETVARAELHAAVAAAVVALDEPYRRAILLRHFEELPVAEVARRTDVPLETARARLRRGRAMLRGRLSRDVGGDRPLAVALLPLTRGSAGSTGAVGAAGGVLMAGKLMAATAVVLVLAGALWWWSGDPSGGADVKGATNAPVEQATVEPDAAAAVETSRDPLRSRARVAQEPGEHRDEATDSARGARTPPAPDATQESAPAPAAAPERPSLATRLDESPVTFDVQDATLREVVGRIAWQADIPVDVDLESVGALEAKTAMNIQGGSARDALRFATMIARLEMHESDDRVVLHAAGIAWDEDRAVRRVEPVADPEPVPPVRVRGRVLAPDGTPVAGATVLGLSRSITTDAEGAFDVEVAPKEYRVRASAPGFVPTDWTPTPVEPGAGEQDVVVAFTNIAARLDVRVATLGQQPLAGAIVRVRRHGTQVEAAAAGDDGVARIRETPAGRVTVRVTAKGHAPAERRVIGTAGETLDVAVTLEPRTLSERLRTERTTFELDGRPLAQVPGVLVGLWDVTVRLDSYVPHETSAKTVSLRVSDDTLEGALRALGQATSTTYRVDDESEIVWISAER